LPEPRCDPPVAGAKNHDDARQVDLTRRVGRQLVWGSTKPERFAESPDNADTAIK
jgi:hypothetical protein